MDESLRAMGVFLSTLVPFLILYFVHERRIARLHEAVRALAERNVELRSEVSRLADRAEFALPHRDTGGNGSRPAAMYGSAHPPLHDTLWHAVREFDHQLDLLPRQARQLPEDPAVPVFVRAAQDFRDAIVDGLRARPGKR